MAVKFSHTNQSHFYLKSHSSLYHKLRRKLWKMGVLYLIFKRAFLFYLIIILKSHSSLYHKLRRKLWKMGVLYLIFKRAFLFYLIIIILYGIIILTNRNF